MNNRSARKPGIGRFTCTIIVIANMVGTGVFTSLGFQVPGLPSGFVLLSLWALGAVFALCGALCYAELAGLFPRSGGEYNFLSRIYGRPIGFMAGFVSATVGFAAPVALAAMAFAKYLQVVFPQVPTIASSTVIACVVTLAHLFTLDSSKAFQNVFTTFKLLLIAVLIVAGLASGIREPISFLPSAGDGALFLSAPFAISLMFVMYSYSGWNASTYILGEVRRPAHDVPWSLLTGTISVGILYVLLNAVFLKTVPLATLKGQIDVGSLSAAAIFGAHGGAIFSLLICIGLISAISAMTWTGPRVAQTIGEDFPALAVFSRRTRGGIPVFAVLFQLAFVLALLWTSTFESVLVYTQFALVLCGLLAVTGVIVLRIRKPELQRPFRCWGYPITPLIFSAMAIFTLVYTAVEKPAQAMASMATLLLSLAIYFGGRRMHGKIRAA
jgi:APA family basic amino acid/polyamine antiporter